MKKRLRSPCRCNVGGRHAGVICMLSVMSVIMMSMPPMSGARRAEVS
ncbi:MAG: hypothetical protein OCU22_01885 [Canidatus Methanoxibalbensis ujae]|nr:hypothetical protein [Candidatus Methanoxibalbensis ujae]